MNWKPFLIDAAIRAVRTVAQTAVGVIGAGAVMSDVDWARVISASALSGIVSLLMSVDRLSAAENAPALSAPHDTEETA